MKIIKTLLISSILLIANMGSSYAGTYSCSYLLSMCLNGNRSYCDTWDEQGCGDGYPPPPAILEKNKLAVKNKNV